MSEPDTATASGFSARAQAGQFSAEGLVSAYCRHLYDQLRSYSEVARRTQLDWRTVKRHVLAAKAGRALPLFSLQCQVRTGARMNDAHGI